MRALATAVIYFGTFLTLGYVAKRLLDHWMAHHGEELHEVQAQSRRAAGGTNSSCSACGASSETRARWAKIGGENRLGYDTGKSKKLTPEEPNVPSR